MCCVWFIPFNIQPPRFEHIVTKAEFLLISSRITCHYTYTHFVYPCVFNGHLGCFHISAIMNATMTIEVHRSSQDLHSNSFGYILRNKIVRLYDSSTFNFLRSLPIVLHKGYTNLHSHQQSTRVFFSSHPFQ